jgi:hypothetical protein
MAIMWKRIEEHLRNLERKELGGGTMDRYREALNGGLSHDGLLVS